MPDWLAVKLIRHNTRREEARDEKQKCPFHRYGSSTFLATVRKKTRKYPSAPPLRQSRLLANWLSSSPASGHNGNDLDVLNF
jgi:hypothetical protein